MRNTMEYERVFRFIDGNGDGKISPLELREHVGLLGGDLMLNEAEIAVMSMDSDGDGLLCLEDFVRMIEGDGGEDDYDEKINDLRVAFGMYDADGCGFITPKSLRKMLSKLGEKKSIDECRVMISHFDLNGDGVLNFDEFKIMML
ncbi:EF-hand domain [Dillenia turbinata]|uniref:EF-hand domain n=1 Tax=Dillenia turbinata TaxID=194707 RepID=A0AAN8V8G4_9MAGN